MEISEIDELKNNLLKERQLRLKAEEELIKMRDFINALETKLRDKNQEVLESRAQAEEKVCSLYMKLGQYKTSEEKFVREIDGLKASLNNTRSDYFKATDSDIIKSTKIEELYSIITQHRSEINALRSQISSYQYEIIDLEREKHDLIKILDIQKENKFCQTEGVPLLYTTANSPLHTLSKSFSISTGHKQSTRSLPIDYSLNKVRTQILSLQKSKARLDMQIRLLSEMTDS